MPIIFSSLKLILQSYCTTLIHKAKLGVNTMEQRLDKRSSKDKEKYFYFIIFTLKSVL